MKTIAIVSGGMDSVVMAYRLRANGSDLHILSFNYGQRHVKELAFAKACARALDAQFNIIDVSMLGGLLPGSSLTDSQVPVPDGHYQAANMVSTVVPNRNAIMLAIAFGIAGAEGAGQVAIAVHSGDHHIYPDCRPEFIRAFEQMEILALDQTPPVQLHTPFLHLTKSDIVLEGNKYHVPFEQTWSCYKGRENHCGTCGTCVERKEAFQLAGIPDPTQYES